MKDTYDCIEEAKNTREIAKIQEAINLAQNASIKKEIIHELTELYNSIFNTLKECKLAQLALGVLVLNVLEKEGLEKVYHKAKELKIPTNQALDSIRVLLFETCI